MAADYATSDQIAGRLCQEWAERLGLSPGIPIPVGALDAHWDAIGAGVRLGDVVNVIGNLHLHHGDCGAPNLVPGVCGVVPGSIHPRYTGIEAGLSATGDIFEAIARRAGYQRGRTFRKALKTLARTNRLAAADLGQRRPHGAGESRAWRRNSRLASDAHRAGRAFRRHRRNRVSHARDPRADGGARRSGPPDHQRAAASRRRNNVLNHVYANVLNKPMLVPADDVTSLGSAIFAFLAAGEFQSVEEAQDALSPAYRTVTPKPLEVEMYQKLFEIFQPLYFGLGCADSPGVRIGAVLPTLRRLADESRQGWDANSDQAAKRTNRSHR